jgi:hypothetical protein
MTPKKYQFLARLYVTCAQVALCLCILCCAGPWLMQAVARVGSGVGG